MKTELRKRADGKREGLLTGRHEGDERHEVGSRGSSDSGFPVINPAAAERHFASKASGAVKVRRENRKVLRLRLGKVSGANKAGSLASAQDDGVGEKRVSSVEGNGGAGASGVP